jgi:hypothetical protein
MTRKKMTDEERAQRERAIENNKRLLALAEKAFAELPESARAERERAGSNGEWLRRLAEKAQAELDRREQERKSA